MKSTDFIGAAAVGDVIGYTFTVTNDGNVTIENITVEDPLLGGTVDNTTGTWPATEGTLAPGETVTLTGSYTVTEADVLNGEVVNTATVTGDDPTNPGTPLTPEPSDPVTVDTEEADPALSIVKSTDFTGDAVVGDVIGYTFTVSNEGNVTIENITVEDPLLGGTVDNTTGTWPATEGTLAPGETVTLTGSYTVTEADVLNGEVVNTATVTGDDPTAPGNPLDLEPSDPVTVDTEEADPALSIVKATSFTGEAAVGDVIGYTFTVTNEGNVTIGNITVEDPLLGGTVDNTTGSWPATEGMLAPGETVTLTGSYTVTEADVLNGEVVNTASVTGDDPTNPGNPLDPEPSDPVTVDTEEGDPALSIVKATSFTGDAAVGDVIDYTFTVTNEGNVTIGNITVEDPLLGGTVANTTGTWPVTEGTLAPGETVTLTGSYTVTEADVLNGEVVNTATVTGDDPTNPVDPSDPDGPKNPLPEEPSDPVTVDTEEADPALSVVKATDFTGDAAVGDVIDYTFTVTNEGNVTIENITVEDLLLGGAVDNTTGSWPSIEGTLAPGETVTLTGSYTVTEADVLNGEVVNTATVTGDDPTDPGNPLDPEPSDPVTTETEDPDPALSIVKATSFTGDAAVGDVIGYTFTVTNEGNVTIENITVEDPLLGGAVANTTGTWPATEGMLAPGETVTLTGSYTVTEADVLNGEVVNTATVTGDDPTNPGTPLTPEPSDPVTVDTEETDPALSIVKATSFTGEAAVGDVIEYTFTVSNDGNVTIENITVEDPLLGGTVANTTGSWPVTEGTLAPGETVTLTGSYTVTEADVLNGEVVNTATVTGDDPTDPGNPLDPEPSDPVTVETEEADPALSIVKSTDFTGDAAAGDVIEYTFVVSNDGNVTIENITVEDPLLGGTVDNTTGIWPATEGTLAPGETVTLTGSYTVTEADVLNGEVVNTATVTGDDPTNPVDPSDPDGPKNPLPEEPSDPVTVETEEGDPALSIVKATSFTGEAAVGDVIGYTFTVENTGNVTIENITVEDPLLGGTVENTTGSWPATAGTLAPGETVTLTGSYTVTEADVLNGEVVNTASVTGDDPTNPGNPLDPEPSDPVTVDTEEADPALSIVKSTDFTGDAAVGDVVGYTFTVSNDGNVTIENITVEDPLLGGTVDNTTGTWPAAEGALAPGETVTLRGSYTVTETDVLNGEVVNTATVTGDDPTNPGTPLTPEPSDPVTVDTEEAEPALSILKATDFTGDAAAGDVIEYTFVVSNDGNVTIENITVEDPLLGGTVDNTTGTWPVTEGTLAPGETVTLTGSYTLTEADVLNGEVVNTASVTGDDPTNPGNPLDPEPSDPVTVDTEEADPALSIVKSTDFTGDAAVGDVIEYTFTVSNDGNVTIENITVEDPLLGGTVDNTTGSWPATAGTLAPGETVTLTGSYTVTEADVLNGEVVNTATVTGDDPTNPGTPLTPEPSDPVTVDTEEADPALSIVKSTDFTGDAAVGDVIGYTFTVTNDGNVTIENITVEDPLLGGAVANTTGTWPVTEGTLAPGETVTLTGSYTVAEADVLNGEVVNTATVTGDDPTDPGNPLDPEPSDPVTVDTEEAEPALSILKATDFTGDAAAGDMIDYTFTVENTGNVTIDNITVEDPLLGGTVANTTGTWPVTEGTLAPGETVTLTGSYMVTEADVLNGEVVNTATVTGDDPTNPGTPLTPEPSDPVTVETEEADPALSIVKSTDFTGDAAVGDVIGYTFTVTNEGNVTIGNITVEDPLLGGTVANTTGSWPATEGTLAPGETVTLTGSYTLTEADVLNGEVVNTATVTGDDPTDPGNPLDPEPSDPVTVDTEEAEPALSILKATDFTGDAAAGDVIDYTFTVSNDGNVTIENITVEDPLLGGTVENTTGTWPATEGTLAPGETVTLSGSYTVTEADVLNGEVVNTATVTGDDPTAPGNPLDLEPSDPVTVDTEEADPALSILKATDFTGDAAVGDVIDYTFTVTNEGNVTIGNITVEDPLLGGTVANTTGTWPVTEGTLAPGETVTLTGSYTVTEADVLNGEVVNTASVTGDDPTNPGNPLDPEPSDPVTVDTEEADPALSVVKATDFTGDAAVGDVIDYTFTVTNEGNVTIENITVEDLLLGGAVDNTTGSWPSIEGTLAPGETVTLTGSYTVTEADVLNGEVVNTATVTGDDPTNPGTPLTPEPSDPVTVDTEEGDPALSIVKSTDFIGAAAVGDVIGYTFTVTNDGNVTIENITVEDPLLGGTVDNTTGTWPATEGTLAPGETVTLTGSYTVTEADVLNGEVVNTATVTGDDPTNPGTPLTPEPSDPVTVDTEEADPALSIVKSTDFTGDAVVGDVIGYTFTVSNEGNVTIENITVEDPLLGGTVDNTTGTWPATEGTLAPGETVTLTGSYTVTEADVLNGEVVNTATVTGDDPTAPGNPLDLEPSDPVTVDTEEADPALSIVKATSFTGEAAVGDVIGYTFTVTNEGNVTIGNITVEDPLLGGTVDNTTGSWPATEGMLAPGETVTLTGSYTVTEADVLNGEVVNTASVTGDDPTNPGNPLDPEPSDPVTVDTEEGDPALSIVKATSFTGDAAVGDVIDYTFTVTNEGNVTIGNITVEDPLLGGTVANTTGTWPVTEGTLAPGETVTLTGSYTVTEADVLNGEVVNTATVTGDDPTNPVDPSDPDGPKNPLPEEPSDPVTVDTEEADPALSVVKATDFTGDAAVGDVIDYTFTVTNEGNVTIENITVEDLLLGGAVDNTTGSWPSIEGTLAPGETVTLTGSYTVTEADVLNGEVVNTATVTGDDPTDPGNPLDPEPSDPVTVDTEEGDPALSIVKSTDFIGAAAVGDVIGYTFTVTNDGNVTIENITVEDPLLGGTVDNTTGTWPATEGTLAPGETVTLTGSYTVTEADVLNGEVVNTATVTGDDPTNPVDPSDPDGPKNPLPEEPSDPVTVETEEADPALSIVKATSFTGEVAVGDVIDYTFTVENTGNITIDNITVEDPLLGGTVANTTGTWPVTEGTLAPGETVTLTGSYTVAEADVLNGEVVNTATVTGDDPTDPGNPLDPEPSDPVTVDTEEAEPALSILKATDFTGDAAAGDMIDYTFTVENTGNVTIDNITVEDPLLGGTVANTTGTWPVTEGTLAPGETVTLTGSYTVTEADVLNGEVVNTASVTGDDPTNPVDPSDPDGPKNPLPEEPSDPVTVETEEADPALSIVKSTDFTGDAAVGDVIDYTFAVSNDGNVTIENITVDDPLLGGTVDNTRGSWPTTEGTLAPGETVTLTGSYTVTEADVLNGEVVNTATVTGDDPTNPVDPSDPDGPKNPLPEEPSDPVTVDTEKADPALSIVKATDFTGDAAVEDVIGYTFTVTNEGNVTIDNITVEDPLLGGTVANTTGTWPATEGTLAPGETVTLAGSYTVTEADVLNGEVVNTATVTGDDPTDPGNPLDPEPSDPVTVETEEADPALSIVKATSFTGEAAVGDVIDYTFTVENTGNITIDNITVEDPLLGGTVANTTGIWPATEGTLAPGETVTLTGSYTVTEADVLNGEVVNTATVTGDDPTNPVDPSDPDGPKNPLPEEPSDPVTVETEEADPALSIVKSTDFIGAAAVGDVIGYTFTVTNDGNVTIENITVEDPLLGGTVDNTTGTWPATEGTLAPGETVTLTGSYTVTEADVLNGEVVNTATVTGDDPTNPGTPLTPEPSDPVTVDTEEADPALSIVKSTDFTGDAVVGDVIGYTFTVSNEGNVTIENITVEDPLLGGTVDNTTGTWPATEGTLAPGETVTLTGSYTVTEADVLNGEVVNTATVTGDDPTAPGNPLDLEPSDPVTVDTEEADPALSIVKATSFTGEAAVGDVIGYTFTVTNEGNVTIGNITVEDPLLGGTVDNTTGSWPATEGMLAPGETVTLTGSYTVTEADVLNGEVVNTATVTGDDPTNPGTPLTPEPSDPVTVFVESGSIVANDDTFDPVNGFEGGNTPSVLDNDTLNGEPVNVDDVILTEVDMDPNSPLTLNPDGTITVAPGTPAGEYELTYSICDVLNSGNCDTATVTVTVTAPKIEAIDDDLGVHLVDFGGLAGNILDNDILGGLPVNPNDVDFQLVDVGDLIGVLIGEDGSFSIIPGMNPPGTYVLTYRLCEINNPTNCDTATITIALIAPKVDLTVSKTSFEAEIYEGDEFDYEIVVRNTGGTPARDVTIVDDLPANVSYVSSSIVSVSDPEIEVADVLVSGSKLTWDIPIVPDEGVITLRIRVKAGDSGAISNSVTVGSLEEDVNPTDNQATDLNQIRPFRIPNVITPNNDGDNDTFEIKGLDKFEKNRIVIINRYGDHVFERDNYQNDWDAPGQTAGTYYYILTTTDSNGESHEFKGWIQVIKN
ncbi:gliding motility-associated C-terminal domain-containing protein [Algoriphagus sp. NG3]|uniref:DUF7507 domain-containing protein n=1 Tax=Algoriphagus sp. NG3 TaxID=3097546 RepID=UPI002A81F25D|nr:gliding motility-associated C-terminal domain-containing protein [Algoriphagus sp. NG3]WPR77747.1 gliding motility-associated C-terminal domain-containing protein [Algoriphagus sp. NG3]